MGRARPAPPSAPNPRAVLPTLTRRATPSTISNPTPRKTNNMTGYVHIEYPKWVSGVLVYSAEEETALRAAPAEAAAAIRADALVQPLSPAGIRMRRTRERRREGKRAILCDISAVQIEALVVAGFLDPARRDDAAEVARGVGRMLNRVAEDAAQ